MANSDVDRFSDQIRTDPKFRAEFLKSLPKQGISNNNRQIGDTIAQFANKEGFKIDATDAKQIFNNFVDQQTVAADAELTEADLAGVSGGASRSGPTIVIGGGHNRA